MPRHEVERPPLRDARHLRQRDARLVEDDRLYAALDLGTNNCRLLVATPAASGFRVVDAFSRIVRLGEGIDRTGEFSPAALERTFVALDAAPDGTIYGAGSSTVFTVVRWSTSRDVLSQPSLSIVLSP